MRNTKEYPITKQEVVNTMDELIKEEMNKQTFGGTNCLVLQKIKGLVVEFTSDKDFED